MYCALTVSIANLLQKLFVSIVEHPGSFNYIGFLCVGCWNVRSLVKMNGCLCVCVCVCVRSCVRACVFCTLLRHILCGFCFNLYRAIFLKHRCPNSLFGKF